MQAIKKVLIALVLIPLGLVVLPFLAIYFAFISVWGLYLKLRIEIMWPQEKFILFTYSDSPNWSAYVKENIVPAIESHAVIINRTQQQNWKNEHPLERKALDAFAGYNVNPAALIFRRGLRVKSIAFYDAFRDLKHGKTAKIDSRLEELISYVPSDS